MVSSCGPLLSPDYVFLLCLCARWILWTYSSIARGSSNISYLGRHPAPPTSTRSMSQRRVQFGYVAFVNSLCPQPLYSTTTKSRAGQLLALVSRHQAGEAPPRYWSRVRCGFRRALLQPLLMLLELAPRNKGASDYRTRLKWAPSEPGEAVNADSPDACSLWVPAGRSEESSISGGSSTDGAGPSSTAGDSSRRAARSSTGISWGMAWLVDGHGFGPAGRDAALSRTAAVPLAS